MRRILGLAGWRVTIGLPRHADHVAVRNPGGRAAALASRRGAAPVRVADAALRSLRPEWAGDAPLGLLIDPPCMAREPAQPTRLEHLLATDPLDDTALLDRARAAATRMQAAHLAKYSAHDPAAEPPVPGYVLVVDQPRGTGGEAKTDATFAEMLALARIENPGARILIRAHPETRAGRRPGQLGSQAGHGAEWHDADDASPWRLMEGAIAVYTVSSQMGFEAILAGHRPRVFGRPWYGGWGLTADESPDPRRARRLTRAQLSAAALILAPTWYDPCRDRLCPVEDVLDHLEAAARAWREDRRGHVVLGAGPRRRAVARIFGTQGGVRFETRPDRAAHLAAARGCGVLVAADAAPEALETATARARVPLVRVAEGILGAADAPAGPGSALSLVADDLGIHHDPGQESRLERLIAERPAPAPHERARARRLIARLTAPPLAPDDRGGLGRSLPEGPRVLVVGEPEDAPSLRQGGGAVRTNGALLAAARDARPDAAIVFHPHPDVVAGRRPGAVAASVLASHADAVVTQADLSYLLAAVDEVWTMTSPAGFEALLRGLAVTCLGAPFYAGWGLTTDRGPVPARREARPDLDALVHAALIAYPRYRDPVTGLPCPVEVAAERLLQNEGEAAASLWRTLERCRAVAGRRL